ncbi:MAG TPA: tetratricopeptide repeat protein [Terriglobales bacterium]|nr:tetratricopeptide repeat protein [Terriglobales bacterium]
MSKDEQSLKALAGEAIALEAAGKLELSLRKWKQIRALEDSPDALVKHVRLAGRLNRWEEAEREAITGTQKDSANGQARLAGLYLVLCSILLNLNSEDGREEHLEPARSYCRKALRAKELAEAYLYIGVTYMRTGDDRLAEQNLRRALELDPLYDEAMYNLAEVIRCSCEPAPREAVELYRKSLEIDPHYAAAYRGLAFVSYDAKQFEAAEEHARRALKLDANDWAAHTILGRILKRKKKFKAAKVELERGAELGARQYDAQAALASFYEDSGSLRDAAEAYRKCLALDPEDAWANRRYGAVLADLGKTVQARVFFKRALALDPHDEKSKIYLDKLSKHPHREARTPRRRRG